MGWFRFLIVLVHLSAWKSRQGNVCVVELKKSEGKYLYCKRNKCVEVIIDGRMQQNVRLKICDVSALRCNMYGHCCNSKYCFEQIPRLSVGSSEAVLLSEGLNVEKCKFQMSSIHSCGPFNYECHHRPMMPAGIYQTPPLKQKGIRNTHTLSHTFTPLVPTPY